MASPASLLTATSTGQSPRRWLILAILSLTQLIVVLDSTIVNTALPSAQIDLGLDDTQRQWVVNAYVLAFGALLLLGGRIADYWGRKRTYLVGTLGFGVASAVGGFAQNGTELIVARGFQGAFAALVAPAALALLTVTFASGRDRNTAFAVFGAIGGAGAAVGLLVGGVLTEFADWRWCLWVNVPLVIVSFAVGLIFLNDSKAAGDNRYDVLGAITVTLGFGSLVYGFTLAEQGWTSPNTIGFLAAGLGLLALFVWIESRSKQPLLPLRIILNRVRGGAFIIQAIAGMALIGAMFYLTFHLQLVLGFRPLEAGLGSLAMTLTIVAATPVFTKVLSRTGPRPLLIVGPLIAAVGFLYLTRISVGGSYFTEVLPGLVLVGVGLAMMFVSMQNVSLVGVAPQEAGAASAMSNVAVQIGGSVGLSVLTAAYAATARVAPGIDERVGFVNGYSAVFLGAAIAMVVASLVAVFLIRGTKEQLLPDHAPTPAA